MLGNVPTSNVVAAAVSNERPSARYLYLLFSDHNFYRLNLATNGIDRASSLDPANGSILSFAPIPAQSGVASLFQVNPTQTVAPGGAAILVGQFWIRSAVPFWVFPRLSPPTLPSPSRLRR